MRSRNFITARHGTVFLALGCFLFMAGPALGQRLAILTPDNTPKDIAYAAELAQSISPPVRVIDREQAEAAFRSVTVANAFNMTIHEAKATAAVVGCDLFLVVRASGIRRTSVSRLNFFEAYAVHYLVDGRTGELSEWRIKTFENESEGQAESALIASVTETARELSTKLRTSPAINAAIEKIETVPDEGTAAATNLKTPVPYKRIKPDYTRTAYLYDVRATVDIEVDVDADGTIRGTKIVRWAGYGLDESAETAVRAMNWRPAMRNGKPLPMRVLLRYNFTKIEKE